MARPDFSEYVIHFMKDEPPWAARYQNAPEIVGAIAPLDARERLLKALRERVIHATPMPWTGKPAVAFTECVWVSLLDHTTRYAPHGIGFKKEYLFQNDGGPVFYMRQDLYKAQCEEQSGFHEDVWPFITPFVPEYASEDHVAEHWSRSPSQVDFTHEREWRVPHDLRFDYGDVEFVIVDNNVDGDEVLEVSGALSGKILLMENYRRITLLWPSG